MVSFFCSPRLSPRWSVLALVLLFSSTGAQAQSRPPAEYQIGPKDLIEIKVNEIPDLNLERRVQDSGNIDLPLLGQVPASGLTPSELRDRLVSLLTAKYVNQAYVTVNVKEFANRPIMILGGISRPGPLNISGRWNLQQALLNAGGVTSNARKVTVLRTADNGLSDRLEINLDELFVRLNPIWNIAILPGDIINVPSKQPVTIFCIGEFKNPGAVQVQSDEKLTLLTLVARAGGFTDKASKTKIRIRRTENDGTQREIFVNYNRILSGKDADPALQAEDVVIVKESLF